MTVHHRPDYEVPSRREEPDNGELPSFYDPEERVNWTERDSQIPQVAESVVWDPRHYETAPEKRSRKKLIAAIAAGAVSVTAMVGFGILRSTDGKEGTPKAPSGSSAPLNPGVSEVPTPSVNETSPSSTGEVVSDPLLWTPDNFPYTLPDPENKAEKKTFHGVAELEAAYGIKVEDYPKGTDAARALVERLNLWLNAANSPEDFEQYAPFPSPDGGSGVISATRNLIAPAWGEVLAADGSAGGWIEAMTNLAIQGKQNYAKTLNDAVPYKQTYAIKSLNGHATYKGETTWTATVTFEDNGDENSLGGPQWRGRPGGFEEVTTPSIEKTLVWYVGMKQMTGNDGKTQYWKIVGMDDTEKTK